MGKHGMTPVQFKIVDLMDAESTTLITISSGRDGERVVKRYQVTVHSKTFCVLAHSRKTTGDRLKKKKMR